MSTNGTLWTPEQIGRSALPVMQLSATVAAGRTFYRWTIAAETPDHVEPRASGKRPNWWFSVAVWAATLALDVGVLAWTGTLRIWHCEDGYGNMSSYVLRVLFLIGLPTAYALWRCRQHRRAEPDRRPVIRGLVVAIAAASAGSVVGAIIVMSKGDQLVTGGGC